MRYISVDANEALNTRRKKMKKGCISYIGSDSWAGPDEGGLGAISIILLHRGGGFKTTLMPLIRNPEGSASAEVGDGPAATSGGRTSTKGDFTPKVLT